jgi:hypothetical protein
MLMLVNTGILVPGLYRQSIAEDLHTALSLVDLSEHNEAERNA